MEAFFKDLIRNESSYKRTNISEGGKGSYQGWYQLHKNELHGNFDQDYQHKKAFDHLNSILNLLTVNDLKNLGKKVGLILPLFKRCGIKEDIHYIIFIIMCIM